jgi:hypothetical protein
VVNLQNEEKHLNRFWIGFLLFSGAFALSMTYAYNFVLLQGIQMMGVGLFLFSGWHLVRLRNHNSFMSLLFAVFYIWVFYLLVSSPRPDYEMIKKYLFDGADTIFVFFIPLIYFFPRTIPFYRKVFSVIVVLAFLQLLYIAVNYDIIVRIYEENLNPKYAFEYFVNSLSAPASFILLTFPYHSKKTKLFIFVVIIITALIAIYRARRALILITLCPLIIAYYLYVFNSNKRFLVVAFSSILFSLLLLFGADFYMKNKDGIFAQLEERGLADTRSNVEVCFYQDFELKDWIVGRGLAGTYYCPGIDIGDTTGYRAMIETDYLNIILKGGVLYFGVLLLMIIPAMIKGFFFSKNVLSKAAATWILFWLLSLYPTNVHAFTMNYVLVWISVGICHSYSIRNMPDKVLQALFKKYDDSYLKPDIF